MKKKTKKSSYKNAIAIAVASFASIALISTGLAAFVIVKDASETEGGNITVGEVVDSGFTLTVDAAAGGNRHIVFDARHDDLEGRVQFDGTGSGEKLQHTITGSIAIGGGKTLDGNFKLTYTFVIRDKDNSIVNSVFITNFIETNRVAPILGFGIDPEMPTNIPVTIGSDPSAGTFSFPIGFAWGTRYNQMNPGDYYDIDPIGAKVEDADVLAELNALHGGIGAGDTYRFELIIRASSAK